MIEASRKIETRAYECAPKSKIKAMNLLEQIGGMEALPHAQATYLFVSKLQLGPNWDSSLGRHIYPILKENNNDDEVSAGSTCTSS